MAAKGPVDDLVLGSTSLADDLAFVALTDIASIMGDAARRDFRIIGGIMVGLHVQRWQLGAALRRETRDADLGIPPVVVRDANLVERLTERGYKQVSGDRFARPVPELPTPADLEPNACIDILVPAYTGRPRSNVNRSGLVVTEAAGLATALQRPPVELSVTLRRLDGQVSTVTVLIPDEIAALVLKAHAWRARTSTRDAVDIWRCLEICHAAGVDAAAFGDTSETREAVDIVGKAFQSPGSPGSRALITDQQLTKVAGDQRVTRIKALTQQTLGPRP